jgi:hypothetical protein
MKHELKISIAESKEIVVGYDDFEAEGFTSGFVLFHAIRNAFLESNQMELTAFDSFITNNYQQLDCFPTKTIQDFNKTWQLFRDNHDKRVIIYEWVHSGSMLTCWNNYLEVIQEENSKSIIYSVCGFDYELDGMGWDCSDDFKSILNYNYLELENYLEKNQEVDFNSMIDYSVYDETGKCVFLIERDVRKIEDSKLLNILVSDINDNILPVDEYNDAYASLKKLFN